jgi:hypothetical protein
VPNFKTKDIAALIDFLERESRQYELFKNALDVIARIGSLASAETEARRELEATQADLAWAKAELENVQNDVAIARETARQRIENCRRETEAEITLARHHHEEEAKRLEGALSKERDILSKVTRRIEAAQAIAELMAKILRKAPDLAASNDFDRRAVLRP